MTEAIRLQKFLSRTGRASRREAERLMLEGRVAVNGEVVTELGTRVVPGRDEVSVDGTPVAVAATRWIAFHKPPGVLTTRRDPHGGDTIYDRLPSELRVLRYVGRLDRDAEGLLILTNDGDRSRALQHPSGEVEREYRIEVAGTLTPATIGRLLEGVVLADGNARAKAVTLLTAGPVTSTARLVLTEGRKREVRRMMSAVGHAVLRLCRVRFGPVKLGDLQPGQWRDLDRNEIEALASASARRGN
jgi:23S rRNA pseudouridine2605 synthase